MKPVGFCFALVVIAAAACVESNVSAASGPTGAARQAAGARIVPHETLKTFLPTLSGWTRGEIHGDTSNEMGLSISRVQADYEKAGATLSYEIMDSSLNPTITGPFLMAAKMGLNEQTADGYTKGMMVAGFPAIETWTPASKSGELALLIGGRYLVKVNGNNVADVEAIRTAVQAVDLKKLAALK